MPAPGAPLAAGILWSCALMNGGTLETSIETRGAHGSTVRCEATLSVDACTSDGAGGCTCAAYAIVGVEDCHEAQARRDGSPHSNHTSTS